MKRSVLIEAICLAFIILFVYTSLSKLFSYPTYLFDLNRSPYLKDYATAISIVIPGSELLVTILLFSDKTKLVGLVGALILMIAFTIYVIVVLTGSGHLPCTCGGIIRELTWKQHLIFNICFTILALWGVILKRSKLAIFEPKNDRTGYSRISKTY
jgi:hypothetical protein